ncbi:MAG TPA: excinuclease ABC subunit UvrA [Candidatus Peribacterales bacterium]|nr:excinuclease ABC subunit UvrA [Candidatus Peribacterales bacterium]
MKDEKKTPAIQSSGEIRVKGARMHNLKNVNATIPRNKLTVLTGLSGSGKSSLAFDTIFAEGQRRYVESLSAYARQFIAQMEKPDVDSIDGLSPAISIDQKSATHNPRSTVGTVTEIYDYMRLLWAKVGRVHCSICGKELKRQSASEITQTISEMPEGSKVLLLAPVVQDRKGEHTKILEAVKREGFVRMRVDGAIMTVDEEITLDPKKKHTIEIVVDRLIIKDMGRQQSAESDERLGEGEKLTADRSQLTAPNPNRSRLADSVELCLKKGSGMIVVVDVTNEEKQKEVRYCESFVCNDHPELTVPVIEPRSFSFNSPHGACEKCHGLGTILQIDEANIIPNPDLTIEEGAIHPWATSAGRMGFMMQILQSAGKHFGIRLDVPWKQLTVDQRALILNGSKEPISVAYTSDRFEGTYDTTYEGVIPNLERRYADTDSSYTRSQIEEYMQTLPCEECKGLRLRKEILGVTVGGKNVIEATNLPINHAREFFETLVPPDEQLATNGKHEKMLSSSESRARRGTSREAKENKQPLDSSALRASSLEESTASLEKSFQLTLYDYTIAKKILIEIIARLSFLENVGLSYLTLERSATTLSGGEAQRIRLATQIGSALQGVLYVLDEPSIGLHQRDNSRLIRTIENLRDLGNTVLVVEHDQETMEAADYILEIGPGAGKYGGTIVAEGTIEEIKKNPNSTTGQYLSGKKEIVMPKTRRSGNGQTVIVSGATHHNLQNVTAEFPLGCFIGVTGVSGSGKSSLIHGILGPELQRVLNGSKMRPQGVEKIEGLQHLDKAIVIDQSPIGRTPRSNPATYTGIFTEIRDLFSVTPEAKLRGYKPGRFSFNVKGGRCEECEGDGLKRIEMHFLPDVYVTCESCRGRRYNRETLEVTYKGRNIADALEMTVSEALEFFSAIPQIQKKLQTLLDVGLGYIHLGQSATTLSGGEAQRIKLATELTKRATGKTFYILDEPTTGLHFDDIQKLLDVLQRLVGMGNTVLVIEHNLDVIKSVDHVIDLGPEGGEGGGLIIATGTPEEVAEVDASFTGQYLKKMMMKK